MSTYSLPVACNNCGHRFHVSQIKGKERPATCECPNCGCFKITYLPNHGRCQDRNWFAETCDVFFNGRAAR